MSQLLEKNFTGQQQGGTCDTVMTQVTSFHIKREASLWQGLLRAPKGLTQGLYCHIRPRDGQLLQRGATVPEEEMPKMLHFPKGIQHTEISPAPTLRDTSITKIQHYQC